MASRVTWNGPKVKQALEAELHRRLTAAAIVVAGRAKALLSVAGTGRQGKGRVYGAHPSQPGAPPKKQTGRLRASISYEVAGRMARVGTNVKYGRLLELGTRKMAARPWLRRALAEMRAAVVRILGGG